MALAMLPRSGLGTPSLVKIGWGAVGINVVGNVVGKIGLGGVGDSVVGHVVGKLVQRGVRYFCWTG